MQLKVTKLSDFLNEALPLSFAKAVHNVPRDENVESVLKKAFPTKERVYIDLDKEQIERFNNIAVKKCVSYPYIEKLFKENNITIIDFVNNVAKEPRQNNTTKITKVLSKLGSDLLNAYIKDYLRIELSKNKEQTYKIVISKAKYDIAGMSTDRYWESCMKLDVERPDTLGVGWGGGVNAKYVQKDIKAGTIIAYLVAGNDTNIKNPFGRVLIKPFKSESGSVVWYPESMCYGNILKADLIFENHFVDVVKEWVNSNLNAPNNSDDVYTKDKRLYKDDSVNKLEYVDGKLQRSYKKGDEDTVSLIRVYRIPNMDIDSNSINRLSLEDIIDDGINDYEYGDNLWPYLGGIDINTDGMLINPNELANVLESYLNDNDFYKGFVKYIKSNLDVDADLEDDLDIGIFKKIKTKSENDIDVIIDIVESFCNTVKYNGSKGHYMINGNIILGDIQPFLKMRNSNTLAEEIRKVLKTSINTQDEDTRIARVTIQKMINASTSVGIREEVLPKTQIYKTLKQAVQKNNTQDSIDAWVKKDNVKINIWLQNVADTGNYEEEDYDDDVDVYSYPNCVQYTFKFASMRGGMVNKLVFDDYTNPYCG